MPTLAQGDEEEYALRYNNMIILVLELQLHVLVIKIRFFFFIHRSMLHVCGMCV